MNITEKFLIELGIGSIGYSHNQSESTQKTEYTNTKCNSENYTLFPESGNFWAYENYHKNVVKYGYLYDWETEAWHFITSAVKGHAEIDKVDK